MLFPEIRRQLLHAADQQVRVFDGLVARIVLGLHAEDRGLDPQIDVLRYQRDACGAEFLLQCQRVGQDRVVRAVPGQAVRQHGFQQLGLKEQAAARRALAVIDRHRGRQRQAAIDLLLGGALHQLVEKAADLAHVARRLRQTFLARVEFLEHGHRNVDVVLFEAKDGGRIVHQDIRVEHEDAALAACPDGSSHTRLASGRTTAGHSAFTAANTASA